MLKPEKPTRLKCNSNIWILNFFLDSRNIYESTIKFCQNASDRFTLERDLHEVGLGVLSGVQQALSADWIFLIKFKGHQFSGHSSILNEQYRGMTTKLLSFLIEFIIITSKRLDISNSNANKSCLTFIACVYLWFIEKSILPNKFCT